jgi:DNA-binding transcriptional ArsR family regulator
MSGGHLDRTLAALAEPTRRGVVDLLRRRPHRASDLADALSVTRPAMSRHLRVLRRSGLVRETIREQDARERVYELQPRPFVELQQWLAEVEAFWGEQLEAFRAHAEAGPRRRR